MEAKVFEDLYFDKEKEAGLQPPHVQFNQWLVNGEIRNWTGETCDVHSPILIKGSGQPTVLGILNDPLPFFWSFKKNMRQ